MAERLYEISGCPANQRSTTTMVRELARAVAYTVEGTAEAARSVALWQQPSPTEPAPCGKRGGKRGAGSGT